MAEETQVPSTETSAYHGVAKGPNPLEHIVAIQEEAPMIPSVLDTMVMPTVEGGEVQVEAVPDLGQPATEPVDPTQLEGEELAAWLEAADPKAVRDYAKQLSELKGSKAFSRAMGKTATARKDAERARAAYELAIDQLFAQQTNQAQNAVAQAPPPAPIPLPAGMEMADPATRSMWELMAQQTQHLQMLEQRVEQRDAETKAAQRQETFYASLKSVLKEEGPTHSWWMEGADAMGLPPSANRLLNYMSTTGIDNPAVAFKACFAEELAEERADARVEEALKNQRAQLTKGQQVPPMAPVVTGGTPAAAEPVVPRNAGDWNRQAAALIQRLPMPRGTK